MSFENPFLPTTTRYDENRFVEDLQDNYSSIAQAVNQREVGTYTTAELANSQEWLIGSTRHGILRKVVNTGTLPNTSGKSVAHGITINSNTFFTTIRGVAKNPSSNVFIPLPFADPVSANNINLFISGSNIIISAGINRSAYTESYVILEYWQV